MKIARFFAAIFACIGVLLLIGSLGFVLLNRNADVKILELPRKAVTCSDNFAQALNEGDLETAAQLIYGQPELGVSAIPEDPETAVMWQAFCHSISFEFTGKIHAAQSELVRTGSITTLDIASVMEKLPERTQALINQKISFAENMSQIYDEDNQFREELVDEILLSALQKALTQDAKTVTREVTVKLVKRDGNWWVVPDQALLQALSGMA